jgi:uncharacterized spore protein YtfJ
METTSIERTFAAGAPVAQEILRSLAHAIETEGNVKAVFGDPVKLDGHTIIPVAGIFVGLGGGGGFGGGIGKTAAELAEKLLPRSLAAAGGGGINVMVRPVGFIHEGKEGVVFTPIATPELHRPR